MRAIGLTLLSLGCVARVDDTTTPYGYTGTDWTPYSDLPIRARFQWTNDRYEDVPVQYYIPDQPRAEVWVFHGSGGGLGTVTQIEWLELYNRLVPQDVAIILVDSENRTQKQWDTSNADPERNVDFLRLQALRGYLVANTPLSDDTPVIGVGFSNGGNFTPLFASMALQVGWDLRTFSVHSAAAYNGVGVPAIFTSEENDTVDPAAVADAAAECTALNGTECPLLVGHELPVDPRRFARLALYNLRQSQDIFDELVEMKFIDSAGNRIIGDLPDDIDQLMSQFTSHSRVPSPSMPPTQIRVVWATHRFSSEHVDEEAAFLLDQI